MTQPPLVRLPTAKVNRTRRWLIWIALVALVPLSLYGWRAIQENLAKRRLNTIIQQTDTNDPNWRVKKLQQEYELREVDHDLTKALQSFVGFYRDSQVVSQAWRNPNRQQSNEQLTLLRNRLNTLEVSSVRNTFRKYADQPARRFADDYRGTRHQRTALRKQIEDLMRYASDDIMLALYENRTDEAISLLQSQLALLGPLDACPNLTLQGERHHLLTTCAINIQTMLAQGKLSEDQLVHLQKALVISDKSSHLLQLQLIRAEANDMLEKMRKDSIYRDDCFSAYFDTTVPNASWHEQVGHRVKTWYRQYWATDTLIEAQAEVLEALQDVIVDVRRNPAKLIIRMTWPVTNHVAQRVLSDNYSMIYSYANAEAMIRSAYVGVACERYRLKTNHWPKSLDELMPQFMDQVPLDPYTGKPLLFWILPDGAVVYSVGLDLKDDGGYVLPTGPGGLGDRGIRLYDPNRRGVKYEEGQ